MSGDYKNGLKFGLWSDYYNNGRLRKKENYMNGVLDGLCERHNEFGYIEYEGEYCMGQKHGHWRIYEYREDNFRRSFLKREGSYYFGNEHGMWKIYREGKLVEKGPYEGGLKSGMWDNYSTGSKVMYEKGVVCTPFIHNHKRKAQNYHNREDCDNDVDIIFTGCDADRGEGEDESECRKNIRTSIIPEIEILATNSSIMGTIFNINIHINSASNADDENDAGFKTSTQRFYRIDDSTNTPSDFDRRRSEEAISRTKIENACEKKEKN